MKTIADKLADALRAVVAYEDDKPGAGTHGLKVYRDAEDAIAAYDAQRAAPAGLWAHWTDGERDYIGSAAGGDFIAEFPKNSEHAARIVACVNACHGMTLEEVESFGSPGELGRCAQLWASDDGEEVTP